MLGFERAIYGSLEGLDVSIDTVDILVFLNSHPQHIRFVELLTVMGGAREARAPPPPLFLDQTEAQRAEKVFLETASSPLSKGLDDCNTAPPRASHLSQGLDLAPINVY